MALRAILGDEAADLKDASEVELGGERFRGQFSVIASDRGMAERLLTSETEAAILDSGLEGLTVLRWKNRLQLRRMSGVDSVDEVARMVTLGQVVAAAGTPRGPSCR